LNNRKRKKLKQKNGYKTYKNFNWNRFFDEILEEIKQEELNK